jgi:malate synthase
VADVTGLSVVEGELESRRATGTGLADPDKFVGYRRARPPPVGAAGQQRPAHRDPHRPQSPSATDAAGISDVVLESAITTIMDFEDSVAAVDADDKVLGYRNWLGLNKGDLAEEVSKGGKTFTACSTPTAPTPRPTADRAHPARPQPAVRPQRRAPDDQRRHRRRARQRGPRGHPGRPVHQPDRAARAQGRGRQPDAEQPHRIDLHRQAQDARPRRGAFTCELFSRVEDVLGLPQNTIKVGIMDEERRTTLNLKACIKAAAAGGVHQHRLPGPHRRRDPHLDGPAR